MKTNHGYDVVESLKIESNLYLVRIVRENKLHNHVTWLMREDGSCFDGCYFSTEEQAKKSFQNRKLIYA